MYRGFLKYSLLLFLLLQALSTATIRYVSKTGTSTPPYLTWETASDSIQKCLNICNNGDTVIVANGVYKENLIMNKYLWLIGSSMDSTVIDGTGLGNTTVDFQADGHFKLFTVMGKGQGIINTRCIWTNLSNAFIDNCKFLNAYDGINLIWSSSIIDNCIITKVNVGCSSNNAIDTAHPVIQNSVFSEIGEYGIDLVTGRMERKNNIVISNSNAYEGIGVSPLGASRNIISNNIVSGFMQNIWGNSDFDTAFVYNNVSVYNSNYGNWRKFGFGINNRTKMRNNIAAYNSTGTAFTAGPTSTNTDYNLYWNNGINTTGGLATHDIVADPMFVKDTVPVFGGSFNYLLQKFSPAVDRGDPDILDVDGSRSDIGAYGGPGGIKYTYLDLSPKPPVNLSAWYDSISINLKWNRNTEADFAFYKLYRDTVPGFPVDSTTFILSLADTGYTHLIPPGAERFYYRIAAVDSQGNQSVPSEELAVVILSSAEYPVEVNDYMLYNNYPNPFNPSTTIGYRLKDRGYVKLMIYDIKGEIIRVLVNGEKDKGYHETEFRGDNLSSGIYLYRIEVIGEGKLPVYCEMRKMIFVK